MPRIPPSETWIVGSEAVDQSASPPPPPTTANRTNWLLVLTCGLLTLVVIILIASRVCIEFQALYALSPTVAWVGLAAVLILAMLLIWLGMRSWRRYRVLREITQLRMLVESYQGGQAIDRDDALLRKEWTDYLKVVGRHSPLDRERVGRIFNRFSETEHAGSLDTEVVEAKLLNELDQRANALIERHAAQTAVATALASRGFDPAIVLWQSFAVIDGVSQVYAGRPGLWGTLRLLRRGMSAVVFAEIAGLAIQAALDAMAAKALAMLGGRATEGVANGLLMLRFGEAVKRECRPAPCPSPDGTGAVRLAGALATLGSG